MATANSSFDFLDTQALARVGHLELLSMRVVDGFLSGKHRSTHKGGCFEFAEHRAYTAGDEIRLIDWHVYAKSDRYYIKLFEEETNLQALMVVDCSGSMEFGMSTPSKLNYARAAAACLSRLLLRQRDAVGTALVDRTVRHFVPPRANASHLQAVLDSLRRAQPRGETSLAAGLHEIARRMKRRGLLVVFSDCFGEQEPFIHALKRLRLRGHEVLVFNVLAPEELTFRFTNWSRFECLEVEGSRMSLDPAAVRKKYLERMKKFRADLERDCTQIGCDYELLPTSTDLGDALARYLNRRAARYKS